MKKIILAVCPLLALRISAVTFTNGVAADSFARASAPAANYGGAGSLSVSGATATNASGVANGVADSFIRFNTAAMVSNFNATLGANQWAVSGATLQVTETGAPNNAIFDRGTGAFEIRWIANDNWVEGTGNPGAPGASGIAYRDEAGLLNAATDVSLGIFSNQGVDGALNFPLTPAASFANDLAAGGDVTLFLTAVAPTIGFTMNAVSFGTASARPYLVVTAWSRPVLQSITAGVGGITVTANGIANTTYDLLESADLSLAVAQWNSVATRSLSNAGTVSLTDTQTNGLSSPRFYRLRAR